MTTRKTIIAALLTAWAQYSLAQATIADAWKTMPDSIIPILNANARGEILEMQESPSTAATKNLLGGECKLITLTNRIIEVKLSERTGVQLLLLDRNDSTKLICMNRYYGDPAIDSDISFYTTDWKRDTSIKIPSISPKDYFDTTVSSAALDSIQGTSISGDKSLYPIITSASLSEKNGGQIMLVSNAPLTISPENKERNTVKVQKSLKWNGTTFK